MRIYSKSLKIALNGQRSYADKRRKTPRSNVGNFIKIKYSRKGYQCFGEYGMLALRCVGPFKVGERVRIVKNNLEMPPQMSYIHNVLNISHMEKNTFDTT